MERLDKVEKVREKTGVTYEEAVAALEYCNYDVLDAIVMLEQQGKAKAQTAYHTTEAAEPQMSSEMAHAQQEYEQSSKRSRFSELLSRFMEVLQRLCKRGLEVSFVVERNGAHMFSMPTLILVILVLFLFPAAVPLLIIGLFFGFRYHFDGLGSMTVDVNDVMNRAADGAESIRRDVMDNKH